MSTYYDLYKTPDPSGDDEQKPLHARVCSKGTISGKEFMNQVCREQHMPHAMIVGIVQAISTTLGDWLSNGYNVEIEGLGFFSTTLKCARPAMDKKSIRSESIHLGTVKFRPSIEFRKYVGYKMELERVDKRFFPDKPVPVEDIELRRQKVLAFLDLNVCITRAEYARLVHVANRRATSDLQKFLSEGILKKRGGGRSVVYIKS